MKIGYSNYQPCPVDGIGPFRTLFKESVDLDFVDSLKGIDAVLLWGGSDISPILYGEKAIPHSGSNTPSPRDLFEFEICRQAHQEGKPIIGVCRGAQFICAFAGGKLVQDVSGHGQSHNITTFDDKTFNVTSSHHQMLYPYDVQHDLLAWSTEHRSAYYRGLDKAKSIEDGEHKEPEVVFFPEVNGYAVQCHPEWHSDFHLFNGWMFNSIKQHCFGETVCV